MNKSSIAEKTIKKDSISDKVIVENKHAKKNIISDKNISILSALSEKSSNQNNSEQKSIEIEDDIIGETEIIDENFTQEDLEIKWKIFADQIKSDRPRISGSLSNNLPKLEQGFVIEINFENSDLRDDFIKHTKMQLTTFLRKELFNNSITLKIVLEENDNNSKKMIYTPEEKYQYLLRKNPLLEKLKQLFNLELE